MLTQTFQCSSFLGFVRCFLVRILAMEPDKELLFGNSFDPKTNSRGIQWSHREYGSVYASRMMRSVFPNTNKLLQQQKRMAQVQRWGLRYYPKAPM